MQNEQSHPQLRSFSGGGTPVLVDVYAELDSFGAVSCRHEWKFENGPTKGGGRIEIPARNHAEPGTPIHFHLHDNTGRQLRFDSADPMWVSRDSCPASSCEDPEMPRTDFDVANKLLKVMNRNDEECELHYNLRFKDRMNDTAEYDPAIKNGGTTL